MEPPDRSGKKRQIATTNLPPFVARSGRNLPPFAAIGRMRFAAIRSPLSGGRHSPYEIRGLTEQGLESGLENVFQKIFQRRHATGSCDVAWQHTPESSQPFA